MKKEIKTISEIKSNIFTTNKDFNKEYKSVKENFINQLGYNKMPQGLIILCMICENGYIQITSNSKSDMIDWIKKYKNSNNEYFLLIKEQKFLIKSR